MMNQSADERIVRDLTYDPIASDTETTNELEPFMSTVSSRLQAIFERRGAVNMPCDSLIPLADLYERTGRRPVRLLDNDGTVLQLPYDLTVPLCRKVAREPNLGRMKRYAISKVYRPRLAGGVCPSSCPSGSHSLPSHSRPMRSMPLLSTSYRLSIRMRQKQRSCRPWVRSSFLNLLLTSPNFAQMRSPPSSRYRATMSSSSIMPASSTTCSNRCLRQLERTSPACSSPTRRRASFRGARSPTNSPKLAT